MSASADPPADPGQQQISQAQTERDQLADQVGSLSAQVAQLRTDIGQLDLRSELAEQRVADAQSKLEAAQAALQDAERRLSAARARTAAARVVFSQMVRDIYVRDVPTDVLSALLTSSDSGTLLEYGQYVTRSQRQVVDQLQEATLAESNAESDARRITADRQKLTDAAKQAKADADAARQRAAAAQAQLQASLASAQDALAGAQSRLADLNNQRAAYQAYVAQQAAEAAALAASAARAPVRHVPEPVPLAPSTGQWTAAIGQTAVNRAVQYLGWPYSYAAGNSAGPTYGVAADAASAADAGVYGFDCSGLTLYAWGPYLHLDHFAATQYTQAGHLHPAVDQLQPGDLVFWSSNGTVAGIGHVALYVGNGYVVQAPHSGAYIEVTPLGGVEAGYFGATRPLS